jgi:hypothetical protein
MQDHKYNNFRLAHYNVNMSQIGCIYLLGKRSVNIFTLAGFAVGMLIMYVTGLLV